jgi:hypothetical protein
MQFAAALPALRARVVSDMKLDGMPLLLSRLQPRKNNLVG